jgi:SAM-dependent methyltransferase
VLIRDCWDTLGPLYDVGFVSFDGRNIPFEDGYFDGVIMHAVFEHLLVEEIPAMLREIHRVTAPGGFLFVFRTPREGSYLEGLSRRLGLAAHEKLYREEEVESLASAAGFHLAGRNVTDMLPAFPPRGLSLYNKVAAMAAGLDHLLLATPLRRSAHHMALVFQRD